MERKFVSTVNYLRFIASICDIAEYNKESQARPTEQQEETYVGLSIHQSAKTLIDEK